MRAETLLEIYNSASTTEQRRFAQILKKQEKQQLPTVQPNSIERLKQELLRMPKRKIPTEAKTS